MGQSETFIFQDLLKTEDLGGGVTRQIMGYNEDIMLVKVMFEPGSRGDIHAHAHVQTSYVESGSFEVYIDDEKKILNAGDGFFVPSGRKHGVICLEAGTLIDVFNPAREDFLKVES